MDQEEDLLIPAGVMDDWGWTPNDKTYDLYKLGISIPRLYTEKGSVACSGQPKT